MDRNDHEVDKTHQQVHFEHVERTMMMKQRKTRPMQMSSMKVRPIPQSVHHDPKSLKMTQSGEMKMTLISS